MNLFIRKEIRQMLPNLGVALALACMIWLLPSGYDRGPGLVLALFPFALCPAMVVMLALDAFGREISSGTWTLLLSQPVSRKRIWWTKSGLAAGAIGCVFVVWWLSLFLRAPSLLSPGDLGSWTLGAMLFALAVWSGGLWTVLLLRQVVAAFWITVLIPMMLVLVLAQGFEKHPEFFWPAAILVALTYSAAGLLWGRWLFLQAQDVHWTGGTVTLPRWAMLPARREGAGLSRSRRPWRALLGKELRLHQGQLIIAGLLAVAHLAVRGVGVLAGESLRESPILEGLVTLFWVFWLVMPVLVGGAAIAEERKLATLDMQMCLPVRPGIQLAIKMAVVLGLSLALGFGMPVLLESGRQLQDQTSFIQFAGSALSFGLLAFYASSLARSTLQALAPAIALIVVCWLIMLSALQGCQIFGITFWRGWLIGLIGVPMMLATVLVLLRSNWRHSVVSTAVWRHNGMAWLGTLVAGVTLTSAIYNRAWEYLTSTEAVHGAARFDASTTGTIQGDGSSLLVKLPDGRYWLNRFGVAATGPMAELAGDWNPSERLPGGRFVQGTNWAEMTLCLSDLVAVANDGSLWVSAERTDSRTFQDRRLSNPKPIAMQRVGNDHDWKQVTGTYPPLVLVKTDGTLWRFGTRRGNSQPEWPGLQGAVPQRWGKDSDWAGIVRTWGGCDFRKRDGSVWSLNYQRRTSEKLAMDEQSALYRVDAGARQEWNQVAWIVAPGGMGAMVGIRPDGTFRVAGAWGQPAGGMAWEILPKEGQFGHDSDWRTLVGSWSGSLAVTLKSDGTLWRWRFPRDVVENPQSASARRFSTHADWLAMHKMFAGFVALSRDGNLWFWKLDTEGFRSSDHSWPLLLGPSRRPVLISKINESVGQ